MTHVSPLDRLGQPVSTVMTDTFITLPGHASLRDAARAMRDRHIGLVLVTDGDELVGVISERDLATAVANEEDCDAALLADRARSEIVTIGTTSTIQVAVDAMAGAGIRHLVVVDRDSKLPAGVMSARDILAELSKT